MYKFFENNIVWIIMTLIAIGSFCAVVKANNTQLVNMDNDIKSQSRRIDNCEKALIEIEFIRAELKEIKGDLKEVKNILYRPIIGSK